MRADVLAKLHRATDRRLAEWIAVQPVADDNAYIAGGMPSAPLEKVLAYVSETSQIVRTSGNAANSGHNIELRGATHAAKFETSALPFKVESGFEVEMLDPARNGAKMRVAAALPFGSDRTILLLVPA
jgi:hypothetical protein